MDEPRENNIGTEPETPDLNVEELAGETNEEKKLDSDVDLNPITGESVELDNSSNGIRIKLTSKLFDCKQLCEMTLQLYEIVVEQKKNHRGYVG